MSLSTPLKVEDTPPDMKAMGGAILLNVSPFSSNFPNKYQSYSTYMYSKQRQISRLGIKVMEMNFLVNNLCKTILNYESHDLSPDIMTLPGVEDMFKDKTADEKIDFMKRYLFQLSIKMYLLGPNYYLKWI